jgi:CBS domain-containing protein
MQAKKIMTPDVECISPDVRIQDVAKKMKSGDVGFLPVCESDRLVGTVTDRDIVLRVIAEGRDISHCTARDVMTNDVFWCYEDQTADEIGDYMAEKEIRRVLILNRDKRLVGVISIGDLAQARGEQEKAGETIKEITEAPSSEAT